MKKNLAFSAALGVALMSVLPVSVQAAVPQLNGMVVSSADGMAPTGLYELPTEPDGNWNMMFAVDASTTAIYSGVMLSDVYYVSRVNAQYGTLVYLDAFDLTTQTKLWTNYLSSAEYLAYDLAYNPADGLVYGLFSNKANTGIRLCTVTYANQGTKFNVIKELDGYWVALASDADGQLYAIRTETSEVTPGAVPEVLSSSLYKLDRHTGEATLVGETGQKPLLSGSATIETRSGRMFWTVAPDVNTSYLCEVDLSTGQATKLYDFEGGRQIVGLYAPVPLAEDNAPAVVSDASVSFPGGALDGTVTFTAPTTLFDGTPAAGALTYTVTYDGETVASGATSFGATENVAVSVSERGSYTYMVRVANEAGMSPNVEVTGFAGPGTPAAPQSVKAVKNDGALLVSWEAVTSSVDGGYIDPARVTYNVTRMPDGVQVASGVTATSVTVPLDESGEMAAYTFQVTAVNQGIASEAGISPTVVAGTPALPWTESFADASALDFFTVIDGNEDGRTWNYHNGAVRVQFNSSLPMNDWLITPPLKLEAGKTYHVSFKAKSENDRYPERVEALWGTDNNAAAMTGALVEASVPGADYAVYDGYIAPEADGIYYVGIHGISDKDCYYLNVDDITVEAGLNVNTPAAATELSAVADASGDYKAEVSFKAPELTVGGAALSSLASIEVKFGETVLHTFDAPAPGAALSCEVTLPEGGNVTLDIVATNDAGAGLAASLDLFVGVPIVAAPASVTMKETAVGQVSLTWEAVTADADGNPVDPARVKYNVYDVSSGIPEAVTSMLTATEYSLTAAEGEQRFVQYAVSAVTEGGETASATSAMLPVGEPYTEFRESFAGGEASTVTRFERINYGNWSFVTDDADVASQDGDNGLAAMNAYFQGYSGALYTGKVSLSGMSNPVLRFYSYTPDDEGMDQNIVAVSVSVDGGAYAEIFRKTVIEIGASKGWHEVEIPLVEYAGKTLGFRFYAETFDRPYTATYLDNLSVSDIRGIDLEISSFTAPEHVRAGETFTVKAGIHNRSNVGVSGHQLEVYADGELCHTEPCGDIGAMGTDEVEVSLTMHPLAEQPVTYSVAVRHDDDTRDDNDTSAGLTVTPVVSALPAPEALVASRSGGAVSLGWTAPVLSAVPAPAVTDDFEKSLPWAHSAPGWIFADRDNAPVAGFAQVEIPGVEAGKTHASFLTFSVTGVFQGNRPLAAYSGTQYLAAFARYDAGLTDDWAISPELSGEEQTISFWAQSYDSTGAYPEAIEVFWSAGSVQTADFVTTGFTKNPLPNGWAEYKVTLPQGARRFAIRSSSSDSFMLMIDDVTYQPASSHNVDLIGYNVYRDMVRINDAPVASPVFTDNDGDGDHTWVVTAVYEQGESRGSNAAQAGEVGIDAVGSASGISFGVRGGMIVVTGAENQHVTVSAADGKLVFNAAGSSVTEIPVLPGIYVVRAGSETRKLVVND